MNAKKRRPPNTRVPFLGLLGKLLRQLRESKGLLVRQLASELAIDSSLMSRIEYGYKLPTHKQVLRLAEILHIDVQELMLLYLTDKLLLILREESLAPQVLELVQHQIKAPAESTTEESG